MSVLEVVCELQAEDRVQGKGNFLKSCSKTTLVKLLSCATLTAEPTSPSGHCCPAASSTPVTHTHTPTHTRTHARTHTHFLNVPGSWGDRLVGKVLAGHWVCIWSSCIEAECNDACVQSVTHASDITGRDRDCWRTSPEELGKWRFSEKTSHISK